MNDTGRIEIQSTALRGPKRLARNQIRLVSIFIFTGVVALPLALWRAWRDEYAPYRELEELGATVTFQSSGPSGLQLSWARIDLSGKRLSREHLAILNRCNHRLSVDLSNSQLDKDSVESLIAMQSLRHIDLSNSNISQESLAHMRRSRSDLAIGPDESPFNLAW